MSVLDNIKEKFSKYTFKEVDAIVAMASQATNPKEEIAQAVVGALAWQLPMAVLLEVERYQDLVAMAIPGKAIDELLELPTLNTIFESTIIARQKLGGHWIK